MSKQVDRKLIAKWFRKRFNRNPKQDIGYFEEWVYRFRKGTAIKMMDSESKSIWKKLTQKVKRRKK